MIQDKKDALAFVSQLEDMATDMKPYSVDTFDQHINDMWKQIQYKKAKEDLKETSIDNITMVQRGLPINSLMVQGIKTLHDVEGMTIDNLSRLNYIEIDEAADIYEASQKIIKSIYNDASPRIDPDELSTNELTLLQSIYKKWNVADESQALREDIDKLLKQIAPTIKLIKKQKGKIGSLFQSKQVKDEIQTALDTLNSYYQAHWDNLKERYDSIVGFTVDNETLRQHFIKENVAYYTEMEKVTGHEAQDTDGGIPSDIVQNVKSTFLDTTELNATLRSYQEFGAKYALYFKRTLLGDEMGLGKTLQALAMINHLRQNNQSYALIVCPLSIMTNWRKEISKFSNIPVSVFHGKKKRRRELESWQENGGIMITTYEHTLNLEDNDLGHLDALIVDEAHYIKNPDAKRSKSVNRMTELAEYVLFMSGTPLENRLEEMKQLITVLQPEISNELSQQLYLLRPNRFKQVVAPVYLRRNREDVLNELPKLEVIPQWVNFSKVESEFYEWAVKSGEIMQMRQAAFRGGSPNQSPKLKKLLSICEEAKTNGQKVLIFSFFKDVLATIRYHLGPNAFEAITGDIPNRRRQEIIDEFEEAEPGTVLVSQITAGGVGLNIQAANIVILCEPQWKPSTEEQAISRVYRMGQSRNVFVYRLLTENSIDETMLEVLGNKAEVFELYAKESEVADAAFETAETEQVKSKVLELEKERMGVGAG